MKLRRLTAFTLHQCFGLLCLLPGNGRGDDHRVSPYMNRSHLVRSVESLCGVLVMDLSGFLLLLLVPVVQAFSSGQVTGSCDHLTPQHRGLDSQNSSSPYTVSAEVSSSGRVTVHLQGPVSTPFAGFLLQAREVGGGAPVGTFTVTTDSAQLLTCNQTPNSAVSHTSSTPKTSIQVTWTSAEAMMVRFHASFVQSVQVFWVNVTSPVLNVSASTSDGVEDSISSADCGVSKVCFSSPSSCDPAATSDCYFMAAALLPGAAAVRYQLTGSSDGYVAFGFSDDQAMGNDDIYICGTSGDGSVWLQHAHSTGRTSPTVLDLGNVSDVVSSVENGVIRCSFTSSNSISTQRTSSFSQSFYLLFAHGPTSNDRVQYHSGTFISSDKVNISNPQLLQTAGLPMILQAHGALMLVAWMTTSSVGMIVARYLKGMARGKKLLDKDFWFLVHITLMSLTVAATIIAFILVFSYAKTWSGGAHPVLGCLVMILALMQSLLALLRCGPQDPKRFLFNWLHSLNGTAIKALAVAAIFTGLNRVDETTEQWLMKVMGGFVGWEVLFYLLFEAHRRFKLNLSESPLETNSKLVTVNSLLMAGYFLGNFSFLVALLVGIGRL